MGLDLMRGPPAIGGTVVNGPQLKFEDHPAALCFVLSPNVVANYFANGERQAVFVRHFRIFHKRAHAGILSLSASRDSYVVHVGVGATPAGTSQAR